MSEKVHVTQYNLHANVETFEILFFLKFLEVISPFCQLMISLFWTSVDVYYGFQSQDGFIQLRAIESSDSPMVWYLLISWWPAWYIKFLNYKKDEKNIEKNDNFSLNIQQQTITYLIICLNVGHISLVTYTIVCHQIFSFLLNTTKCFRKLSHRQQLQNNQTL